MGRTLSLAISDRLETLIKDHARARGYANLDECVLALIDEALSSANLPRIPSTPQELVAELRKGLSGEGRTPSQQDWEQKKSELTARQRRSKAG